MFLLVTHAIYIIVFAVIVQSYITPLHSGLPRAKSNGTCRCSAVRRHCLIRSPDVVLGERVLRMLISCPECHRIPLTRSVFMFGTIEDTPNIIRTGCIYRKSMEWVMKIIRLWPGFSKVAKHGFKEFYLWKGFFLHVAIVLTCFQSEKSQNKLDSMQSVLLKRFTKLLKMNFKREQSKNSHDSVTLNFILPESLPKHYFTSFQDFPHQNF